MPTILIVNDDGIDSPMLRPMARKLSALGTVRLAVPMEEQSWKSKSMTRFGRVHAESRTGFDGEAFVIGGTPSDCVNLAVHQLFPDPPDWVVSGINIGTNAGLAYSIHSGTLGAALEGALLGLPAVAFSASFPPVLFRQWTTEKRVSGPEAERVIETATTRMTEMMTILMNRGLPSEAMVLSVNFPSTMRAETPVRWVPMQNNRYDALFKADGDGYVHAPGAPLHVLGSERSDRQVLDNGEISVTAISLTGLSLPAPGDPPF